MLTYFAYRTVRQVVMKTVGTIFVLAFTGCDFVGGSDSPKLVMSTDRDSYEAGQQVILTVRNRSRAIVTVSPNLCGIILQLRYGSNWVPDHFSGRCSLGAVEIPSGGEFSTVRELDKMLEPGKYRYADPGGNADLYSQTVTIK